LSDGERSPRRTGWRHLVPLDECPQFGLGRSVGDHHFRVLGHAPEVQHISEATFGFLQLRAVADGAFRREDGTNLPANVPHRRTRVCPRGPGSKSCEQCQRYGSDEPPLFHRAPTLWRQIVRWGRSVGGNTRRRSHGKKAEASRASLGSTRHPVAYSSVESTIASGPW